MGDAIAFCPLQSISEREISLLLERFERALEDTVRWVRWEEGRREPDLFRQGMQKRWDSSVLTDHLHAV